jgi:transcription-repair coupling factor (superfamily II helicase)
MPSREIIYKVAHGQMHNQTLDRVVNDFYDGQFNVLISTTIVESGLDIPDANTIIVYRANMFGLSQLHQLRGRVGRGKTKGFAYLFVNPTEQVSDMAVKRLKAIETNQEIGSGFAIASSDMDIRGSGNMVGEEQSGHVQEVGVELYNQMLAEEVNRAKNHFKSEEYDFTPEVKLYLPTSIGNYVSEVASRLYYYRKIAEDKEGILPELEAKFGVVPKEVFNLIEIAKIKEICRRQKIVRLEYDQTLNISFLEDNFHNPDLLMKFIKEGKAKLVRQNAIGFFVKKEYFFQEVYKILETLR